MERNTFVDNVFLGHLESFEVDARKAAEFLRQARGILTNVNNRVDDAKARLMSAPTIGMCSMAQVWISAARTLKNRKAFLYAMDHAIDVQEKYAAQWTEANNDLPYNWHAVKKHI